MGRSPCCEKGHIKKGAWTREEDERLIAHIQAHGEGGWRSLPKAAGLLRCGKSCRLRWINYLRPDLKRGNFTEDEDELIIKLHSLLGNKWSLIAGRLPGRTDNEIKNYWNTHLRRKLLSRGIDPSTHKVLDKSCFKDSVSNSPGGELKEEKVFTLTRGFKWENQKNPNGEKCGEPSLELRICPPPHQDHPHESNQTTRKEVLCLCCNLGLRKHGQCSCGRSVMSSDALRGTCGRLDSFKDDLSS